MIEQIDIIEIEEEAVDIIGDDANTEWYESEQYFEPFDGPRGYE